MGVTETRPSMSRQTFEAAATFRHDGWWATGEEFIYQPEVAEVEDWNLYGRPGNNALTEAQRVLMMWGDLVGQTQNGGFSQFAYNYRHALALAWRLIPQLRWPDLTERFERAFREQAGDPESPRYIEPIAVDADPDKWRRSRRRFVRYLIKREKPWWYWPSERHLNAALRVHNDFRLQMMYMDAVQRGELKSGGEAVFDQPPRSEEASEAFDRWFYRSETKAKSVEVVAAFAKDRQNELCLLVE